jgi:hypothetical protein
MQCRSGAYRNRRGFFESDIVRFDRHRAIFGQAERASIFGVQSTNGNLISIKVPSFILL